MTTDLEKALLDSVGRVNECAKAVLIALRPVNQRYTTHHLVTAMNGIAARYIALMPDPKMAVELYINILRSQVDRAVKDVESRNPQTDESDLFQQ